MSLPPEEVAELARIVDERCRAREAASRNLQVRRPRRCRGKPKLRVVVTSTPKPLPPGFEYDAARYFGWMPTNDDAAESARFAALAIYFERWLVARRTPADRGDDWIKRYAEPDLLAVYDHIIASNERYAIECGRPRLVRSNGRAVLHDNRIGG
ncbi:hypothetical protein FHW12_003133 [Dokdonella fugitiva]|uniref:Uncharacterized protein n=1 Tax=Dokdonella fugitiva TaxID=328517 RepID=A0A839EWA5_9GAMM|nr:hypothetical protein [Dokdonella fugitiva]MBA8888897.1 hypothetical protein [Dokdonella fugitiva]